MTSLRRAAATFAAAVLMASPVYAQTAPVPAPQVGFQDGFFIQTADGGNRLVLGATAQVDGRFAFGDPKPVIDTFTIRKLRPTLTGRVAKYFDFKFMPDFGSGVTVIVDAYFDIRFSPKFRVRTGKDKTPVGYEQLLADRWVVFPERSLASSLVPNRDIGYAVQGDLSPKMSYAAGVYNGIPDGTSSSGDVDTNQGKDLAGRIVIQPFRSAAASSRPLGGLGFQVGGSSGNQAGALPVFKTSAGQAYFSYASGATANGQRTRVAPALFYCYQAVGGFAEYVRSTQKVAARSGVTSSVANDAWDITGAVMLTGEAATDGIVRPKKNFDPQAHQWGALQLLARIAALDVDETAFTAGLAASGASSGAKQYSLGLDWYPNPQIKYYVAFERTTFGRRLTSARAAERSLILRAQLAFSS